jgi:hypothetical protein
MYYNEKPLPMIELKIQWDGPVQGLAEHRLSVGLFAIPLKKLLTAVRRTASNILRQAGDQKEIEKGRFFAEADQIDIEISSLVEGSSGIMSTVSVQIPPGQILLWPEGLAEDSLERLLVDVERESRGIRRNSRAREYLESLPPVLTSQDYWMFVDGAERRHVHLGAVDLATELNTVPYLIEVTGRVIGVGFSPGPNFVRLKDSQDGNDITLSCGFDDVFRALEMRDADVRVLGLVHAGNKKLLRIQAQFEPRIRLDENTWIFERWGNVLARLAQ